MYYLLALVGYSFGAATMALVAQHDTFQMNAAAFLDPLGTFL
jgi:dienelactone hydrolase